MVEYRYVKRCLIVTRNYLQYYNCERSEFSSVFNGHDFHYKHIYYRYIFQAIRRAVNVLNVSILRVSKYLPNVIFCSANINTKRTNIISSMNWHISVEPPM